MSEGVGFGGVYEPGAIEALFERGELARDGLVWRLDGSRLVLEGPELTILRVDLETFKSLVVDDLRTRFAERRGQEEYAAASSRRRPVETQKAS